MYGENFLMKVILRWIIYIVTVVTSILAVRFSYLPTRESFNNYIKEYKACLSIQNQLEFAIPDYGFGDALFDDVRTDEDFNRVERELIDHRNLDPDYNKNKPEGCFYVIKNGKVCCVCHSDDIQISNNIKSVERLINRFSTDESFDYIFIAIGAVMLYSGLLGKKKPLS